MSLNPIDDTEFDAEQKFLEGLGPLVNQLTYWDERLQKYTLPPQKFDPVKGDFAPTDK